MGLDGVSVTTKAFQMVFLPIGETKAEQKLFITSIGPTITRPTLVKDTTNCQIIRKQTMEIAPAAYFCHAVLSLSFNFIFSLPLLFASPEELEDMKTMLLLFQLLSFRK